jgi:hypothetical protein
VAGADGGYHLSPALDTRLVRLRQVVAAAPPNAAVMELADQVQARLEQVLTQLSDLLERARQEPARTA